MQPMASEPAFRVAVFGYLFIYIFFFCSPGLVDLKELCGFAATKSGIRCSRVAGKCNWLVKSTNDDAGKRVWD